jgi:cell division protein FtsW
LGGAGIGTLGLLLALSSAYRRDRLFVLWDPFSDAAGKGYQTVQSLIAVGSGGFLGQGIGKGFAKFLYLPEQYTDFAYAVFCQEMGFIGGIIVMLLFMAFLLLGFATARRLKDSYSAFVVYGLTLMISLQGLINMAMVLGSFPVTGVPLPFISFGGTSLMTNICSVGLIYGTAVQSIENTEREVRKKRIQAMDGVNPFWQ